MLSLSVENMCRGLEALWMVYANQTHVHPLTKDQLYVATIHTSQMFQDLADLEAFSYHPHAMIITQG